MGLSVVLGSLWGTRPSRGIARPRFEGPQRVEDPDMNKGETVARRIVMQRETWERLVALAEELRGERDLEVSALDVAMIALEAGLQEVTGDTRPRLHVAESSSDASGAPEVSGAGVEPTSGSNAGSKSSSGSGRRRRRRRASTPALTSGEQDMLRNLIDPRDSTRAKQRTIALWLGARRPHVDIEHLRELAIVHDAYNVANFTQNMKKDGDLFVEFKDSWGQRLGWRLTRAGQDEAQHLFGNLLVA